MYIRRHFKAATSVPPLDHVRVRPGAGYALRADFFYQSMFSTQPFFTIKPDQLPKKSWTFGFNTAVRLLPQEFNRSSQVATADQISRAPKDPLAELTEKSVAQLETEWQEEQRKNIRKE